MFERNRIADMLRSAREKQGLTLEQAATAAGVPVQYLRLLEGEANVRIGVSDELYLIPFFRKYARFCGIDAEGMLPEFLGMVQQISGEGSPPIRLAYRPRWGFLWRPAAVLLTIAIAAVLMLRRAPEPPTYDEPAASVARAQAQPTVAEARATDVPTGAQLEITPAPAAIAAATSSADTTVAVTPSPAPAGTPAVVASGAHELRISAIEEAWLALAVGDQGEKQYLLRAGETRIWTGDHFSLTVGNAGGVTVAVDGRELPPIGRPGRVVRNLRLPADAAAPSPAATGHP